MDTDTVLKVSDQWESPERNKIENDKENHPQGWFSVGCAHQGSNLGPHEYQSCALPAELYAQVPKQYQKIDSPTNVTKLSK